MSDTFKLVDKLVNAVSFQFKTDGTSPNVTISKLRNGYYCSVVRFTENKDKTKRNAKVVVCKATASTLEAAVTQLTTEFLKIAVPEKNPLTELETAMQNQIQAVV